MSIRALIASLREALLVIRDDRITQPELRAVIGESREGFHMDSIVAAQIVA